MTRSNHFYNSVQEETKRIPVTAAWLTQHPDTAAYTYDDEADEHGLDPWREIESFDIWKTAHKSGQVILEFSNGGEITVNQDFIIFVQEDQA